MFSFNEYYNTLILVIIFVIINYCNNIDVGDNVHYDLYRHHIYIGCNTGYNDYFYVKVGY